MTDTGENSEAAALADTLTATQSPPQDSVPVHVVQSMREELKNLKEQNNAFANHLQMMQWQQPQQQAPKPQNPFQGKELTDTLTVEDALRGYSDLENRFSAQLAEVKLASKKPDYGDIIKKYLPKATQEDPDLLDDIKRSANPYKTAYMAAMASKAYQDDLLNSKAQNTTQAKTVNPDAEKAINNLKQSGNLASVGNSSKPSGSSTPQFSKMSDEEFRKYKSSIMFRPAKAME